MDRRRELLVRVYIVFLLFALFACMILFKVVKINVWEGEQWRSKKQNNLVWRKIEAERGDIFSEDGGSMVTSVTLFDVYMDLTTSRNSDFKENIDSLCYYLEKYSGRDKSKAQWKRELVSGRVAGMNKKKPKPGTKYYPIAKNLDYLQRTRFEQFPLFRKGQLRGGIIVESKIRRVKPFGAMGSRLLGLNRKNAQNVGLEASYDKFLQGDSYKRLMKKISPGKYVPVHDVKEYKDRKGMDLKTTLDRDIQDVVHHELLSAMEYHDATQGTAIVMDVKTGAIKAMSNFNRNNDGSFAELQNVAVTRMFEPGSTIKLAAVMAMLEDGVVDSDTKVNLEGGKKKFYGETMYDSEPHNIYETDLVTAFAKSSNVGIATLADKVFNQSKEGQRRFIRYYKSFGIGETCGIDLLGEPQRYLNDPDRHESQFSKVSVPWMAHGYEMEMSPLQVLNLYNTVANDGKMMRPYVVSKVLHKAEVIKENKPKVLNEKIASISTIHEVQYMLREVVENGTARRLNTKHYGISGKTGTSKDYGVTIDGKNPYNASFAGFFPSENPRYSMIVVLYNPKNHGYYGGSVAGPVFRNVADKIFALKLDLKNDHYQEIAENDAMSNYNKPGFSIGYKADFRDILGYSNVPVKTETKSPWAVLNPYNEKLSLQKRKIQKKIVPDVVGMGIRDAIYILENLGLKVHFDGSGRVLSQSITPGVKIEGQEIRIRLG